MRNAWRVLAFDVVAPLAAICALLGIGIVLGWPRWWVSACSVLVLLIVEGVMVNVWLLRRDSAEG
jgi:MFS superfamily sulfate permease-like transporter